MNKLTQFTQSRESILGVFAKAKADLEKLNEQISSEIEQNSTRIKELSDENNSLSALKTQNNTALSSFSKLFKIK